MVRSLKKKVSKDENYQILKSTLTIPLLFDTYKGILTEKQREAIDLYYNEDFSLAEIAQHFNITRQGVRDSIKTAETILFKTENQLGLCSKIQKLEVIIDKIDDEVFRIEQLNEKYYNSFEITQSVKSLKGYVVEHQDEIQNDCTDFAI